jgi:hypothetical protein
LNHRCNWLPEISRAKDVKSIIAPSQLAHIAEIFLNDASRTQRLIQRFLKDPREVTISFDQRPPTRSSPLSGEVTKCYIQWCHRVTKIRLNETGSTLNKREVHLDGVSMV